MGFYIDPPTMSKEQFLAKFGKRIRFDQAKDVLLSGTALPVCLMNNGPFTAAAIGYSEGEVAPELQHCFPEAE